MERYQSRFADAVLQQMVQTFGAVVIQGPRAAGKTRTGLELASSSVRLDAPSGPGMLAKTSPEIILPGAVPRLIDEWQVAPGVWNAVRHEVDQRGVPGQFILTGSAVPQDDVTRHSGAGRFGRLTMRTMSLAESGESTGEVSLDSVHAGGAVAAFGGPAVADYAQLLVRGGWPALVVGSRSSPGLYLNSYLDDVCRIDVPGMDARIDPVRMRALLYSLSRNIATEVPVEKLRREAEISGDRDQKGLAQVTVRKYLDALTRVFVLEELPAWAPHLRSKVRLRVRPTWHFVDPSLAAASLGAGPEKLLEEPAAFELLFESLAVRDLRIYADALGGQVFHYRDETGLEVDAVVELRDGSWSAFEIKLGGEEHIESGARNVKSLAGKVSARRQESLRSLNVLTAGNLSYTREDGVNVISLGHLTV